MMSVFFYTLPNNVPTTFSVEESDFLPVFFGRSRLNLNVHLIHSLMEDRVTSFKQLMHNIYKEISKQMFINKIWNTRFNYKQNTFVSNARLILAKKLSRNLATPSGWTFDKYVQINKCDCVIEITWLNAMKLKIIVKERWYRHKHKYTKYSILP